MLNIEKVILHKKLYSLLFCYFTLQNVIIEKYFHRFRITLKNILNKPVFNNINRFNRFSPMNNTVTNKITFTYLKYFPQLFARGPKIPLKQRWHHSLPYSIISIKLDICVSKYLVVIKYLLGLFA